MKIDFLIIGQGLAGSLLAWELIKRGKKVMVIDNGKESASSVSAGLINPVSGQRSVKTADVETLLPAAKSYYRELETCFRRPFFQEMPMRRIFQTKTESINCQKRLQQADYLAYLGNLSLSQQQTFGFHCPLGFIEQKQTGRLLTSELLACLRQWLKENNSLRLAELDYSALKINNHIEWQDIHAEQIVFCEGHHGGDNPWFRHLPFKPAKGDILTLKCPVQLPHIIFNFGQWLIPAGTGTARLGATFEWQFSGAEPSLKGKEELLDSLRKQHIDGCHFQVEAHHAAIRPCTKDRQPFLGRHRVYPRASIFNGFGTKGSLQIPWYSQRFTDYLIDRKPLPPACDINRYFANRVFS